MIPIKESATEKTWETQKKNLKIRFPDLSMEDLSFDEPNKNEMVDKLELKLGIPARELELTMMGL
jgi:hypothetical protein